MSCAAVDGLADARALPAATTCGGSGFATTAVAVASPVLATKTVAVKDWPRLTTAGIEIPRISSAAARWTRIEAAAVAETGCALLASAPLAEKEQSTRPAETARKVHDIGRVCRPSITTGAAADCSATPPAPVQVALAETLPAEASPRLESSRETANDWAVLTTAG